MEVFDLTPDPKVLLALTHTPMSPLDALCELIDNSLDSFLASRLKGVPVSAPLVLITIPRVSEIDRGGGLLRIRDNGPGMSAVHAERALRAGFSGNNPYDSLGLFGMGFNISTGKLGRRTRFVTAEKSKDHAIEVIVDLEDLRAAGTYKVPVKEIPKPAGFEHGTLIEISRWWPDGNANSKFVRRLSQFGIPVIQREIGRRYATILRGELRRRGLEARVLINDEECDPFEHCVWGENRYVTHKSLGQIPALVRIDNQVGSQTRCMSCTSLVQPGDSVCLNCGSGSLRTIEHRIRGWLGIQRFDDASEFGIDLIRNGRTIRIGEKAAFFEYTDDLKNTIKDYPIDQQYGRIVGEIHIDHTPVDFLKQDFQRTSVEWTDAMRFLRGESSFQPKQPNAENNQSPLYKLYQGYRRVRDFGKRDMYMGFWDKNSNQAKRISREIEKDYYKRFQAKEPGYYDDAEWWKLVEQADNKPLEDLVECPECHAQNLASAKQCVACGHVLIGKHCVNSECRKLIQANAEDCPYCGAPQTIEVEKPWICNVCKSRNSADCKECSECSSSRGTPDPLSEEALAVSAHQDDELSLPSCSVRLADGSNSDPIDVDVYLSDVPIRSWNTDEAIPAHTIADANRIKIYIDAAHPLFAECGLLPQQLIADEVARFVHLANSRLVGSHRQLHTVPIISWKIVKARWGQKLNASADSVKQEIKQFIREMRDHMLTNMKQYSAELYEELRDGDRRELARNVLDAGVDPTEISHMKSDGRMYEYIKPDALLHIFKKRPEIFLNGAVWDWSTRISDDVRAEDAADLTARYVDQLQNWLSDIVSFLGSGSPVPDQARRTRLSLQMLRRKLS